MIAVTLRLDIEFAAPLDSEGRTRVLLAAAGLPEARRIAFSGDGRRATIYAAELAPERMRAALVEAGAPDCRVASQLAPEAAAELMAAPGERFRPIGR